MRMKKRKLLLLGVVCAALYACSTDQTNESGKRVSALDDAAWNHSEWISVANAPVITGEINGSNERAADGAAWFVSVVKNEKEINSARWMTTGLGVYELYVNGKLIGEEILKPGFTHPYKTKRSFTYEVSNALSKQGFEYQVQASIDAIREGKIETPCMPHAETLHIMQMLDDLRSEWGVRYPMD